MKCTNPGHNREEDNKMRKQYEEPLAASVFPDHTAIIHGPRKRNYADFYPRARRLASALSKSGIERGDAVSVMLANTPAMLEARCGVPMTGVVLNPLNTRFDPRIIAFTLDHADISCDRR
jgi:fatty-acyl-CoA synthase